MRIIKKTMSLMVSFLLIFNTLLPVSAKAVTNGSTFNFQPADILTITIRNGGTGHAAYLDDKNDLQKAADILNSFRYKRKVPAADADGYQYMIWIEFSEKNMETQSFMFTENSICVEGEWLISDTPFLSELAALVPEEADYLFDDVSSDDRCYNDVKYAVENKIFYGVSNTCFDLGTPLNRGMAVTVIHRLAGCPSGRQNAAFRDVGRESWYTNAVHWAAEAHIVSGVGNDMFLPAGLVTREQMAVMMYKYVQQEGYANASGDLSEYTDGSDVSPWAKEAMEWTIRSGIIRCKTDIASKANTVLDPQGKVSRADAAGMMRKLNEYIVKSQTAV